MGSRRGFGAIRRLPSGRYQASYVGPDLLRRSAPTTFAAKQDAEGWLADRQRDIAGESWRPPVAKTAPVKPPSLGEYFEGWFPKRAERKGWAPRTEYHYRTDCWEKRIAPSLADLPITAITRETVEGWYDSQDPKARTIRAHAYGLLSQVLKHAARDGLIAANPCDIEGAAVVKRAGRTEILTPTQLAALVAALPEHRRAPILVAGWCGLRFGEIAALRVRDLDLDHGLVHVRRGVYRVPGQPPAIRAPKSAAGVRSVAIPPHLLPLLRDMLHTRIAEAPGDALLFPARAGGPLAPSSLYKTFYRARAAIGRPDLRVHDLRHTSASWYAQTGATLAEIKDRLGHSTFQAAMRYQHSAGGRDATNAARMSQLAAG